MLQLLQHFAKQITLILNKQVRHANHDWLINCKGSLVQVNAEKYTSPHTVKDPRYEHYNKEEDVLKGIQLADT